MVDEAQQRGGVGITGVTSELRRVPRQHRVPLGRPPAFTRRRTAGNSRSSPPAATARNSTASSTPATCRSSSSSATWPIRSASAAGLLGGLKSLGRGEIKEFSDIFNTTRHLALQRIVAEARAVGANAVVGIETRDHALPGRPRDADDGHRLAQPGPARRTHAAEPVTSDLTCEEMWNLTNMGYMPLKLVLGTAVYSLGILGGLKAMFKSFVPRRDQRPDLADLRRPRARHRPDHATRPTRSAPTTWWASRRTSTSWAP